MTNLINAVGTFTIMTIMGVMLLIIWGTIAWLGAKGVQWLIWRFNDYYATEEARQRKLRKSVKRRSRTRS